jgi:uncharacterized membrane protein YwzB
MMKLLVSTAAQLVANAVGLLLAAALLPGFTIDVLSVVVAVVIFSVAQWGLGPLITKLSVKHLPQLLGGIALVTIFLGLAITDFLMPGLTVGGIANWLAATLLVWIGSLLASILLPIYVFKSLAEKGRETRAAVAQDATRAEAAAARAEAAASAAAERDEAGSR